MTKMSINSSNDQSFSETLLRQRLTSVPSPVSHLHSMKWFMLAMYIMIN